MAILRSATPRPRLLSHLFSRISDARAEQLAGPIAGELLGADQLADRARAVAAEQRLRTGKVRYTAPLLARLDETRRILDVANRRLTEASERGGEVGPAGDWLLDNYFVVQEHILEVRASLPSGYYRELPELAEGTLAGYPRVYEVAITLISHTEGRIDLDNVHLLVGAFQSVTPLRIGELWAIPAMLRLGLIENVRRMALRTVQRLDEVERADRMASHLLDASQESSQALGTALTDLVDGGVPLSPVFISRFLQRLRFAAGAFAPLGWLEQWIAESGMSGEQAASLATQRLAMTQIVMANSITSLRSIARMDWREFVERQSAMEKVLRRDPSGDYERMTFATRDHYRHVVERIAARTKRQETVVARHAIDLAAREAATAEHNVRSHVGYYLIDAGLPALERTMGYRPRPREALHRFVLRHPNVVFGGGVLASTILALIALFRLAGPEASSAWLTVIVFGLIPASEIALSVVNRLVVAFLPPAVLPKLELREHGVPEHFRTAVVIPTLFGSVEAVQDALETIEVQFLANREAFIHFAILSDYTDAATEHTDRDDAIRRAAIEGVEALNARYAPESRDAFYLFHRDRRWNPAQGVWMGWERKRGKLSQFNHFLRGQSGDAFSTIVGNTAPLANVRYVITLDSDTVLPPDAAPLLIGTLAHPLNRAVYDAAAGRVMRGYGILQPRVGVSLPSANRSLFAAIQSGQPGVDPYTTAVSDVYQDLYHEGSFTGKGIYDVDAFERATLGRFPENRLLSHDLIEGSYARAGLVTDITVYDDYPTQYLTYTRRKHRWIRGDWQLLRWLAPRVPGPDGREPNRLSLLSRWKIFDNLRRSVVEISLMALLFAGWWVLPGSPLRWTLLAMLALAAPWIISLLIAMARPPFDKSWSAYYAAVGRDAGNSALQVLLTVTFLPHQAWISADAILRTLWRVVVSRRKLLEWQTAQHVERRHRRDPLLTWRQMWPISAGAIALLVIPNSQLTALIPLFLVWFASPAVAYALGSSALRREHELSDAERASATRYARLHWHYYEAFVTEGTHWLTPDNFQEDPAPVVAMRTSPTNIGLQLLATVSAHDLGFITLDDMAARIELTMRSMERLRRFRGHLYNWYDLHDLRVLDPPYISTVDSGNLAGHLIALRQALLALANESADSNGATLGAQLRALADRADDFVKDMDFSFLYDERRELFAIGYQQSSHSLDSSFYDLLASEARLASFIAIARNEIPVDHWFHLGRTLTRTAGSTTLVSWSGSMFEYLMPPLVMQSYPYTLLDQTYRGAVKRQIAFGEDHGVPWGTSESAYNLRDRHATYQYRAFGVPDLALERRIGHDLVVAPYASALALDVTPERALENLAKLESKGALGAYGFYDALDYTRPEPGNRFAIVRNHMAHHVGMSLVALTNVLHDRVWKKRFHSDPLVRAVELLLHERIPRRLSLKEPRSVRTQDALPDPALERPVVREVEDTNTLQPHVALLGRLPYTIMISHCGGGYSRYEDMAVTRWRADGTADNFGQFCYVKDVSGGHVWSAAHQPTCAPAEWYHAQLATDRVTFHRREHGIETRTEVVVVPEDSAEVRRITVTNETDSEREIELTSYGEIVIAPPGADRQHPAFSNLFVQTQWHEWCSAITATRRPRSATERTLWCVHVVDSGGPERVGHVSFETDRARFLGRGRSTRNPIALHSDEPLSGSAGAVLDPIFAIRARVKLRPRQSASVTFTTLVADTPERAYSLADRYHHTAAAQRAFDLAWTSTQVELRELGVSPADAAVFQELAGHLFYQNPLARAPEEELRANRGGQPLLWSQSISGDWPILLATIRDSDGLPTVKQLFAAHHYWRRRGMTVDLVIVNEHPSDYLLGLDAQIKSEMFASSDSDVAEQPGGVFIRRRDQISPDDFSMLRATARALIACDGRPLHLVLSAWREDEEPEESMPAARVHSRAAGQRREVEHSEVRRIRSSAAMRTTTTGTYRVAAFDDVNDDIAVSDSEARLLDNGMGALVDGNDYEIRLGGDNLPPAPWANVIANERGGFIVTERGAGCTWIGNAQFYRLTPWHNDPVSDPASDALYLRDDESGDVWSPTPAPIRSDARYSVRHSAGKSTFARRHGTLETTLTYGMAGDDPVRIALLRITNSGDRPRAITLTAYVEWTLGPQREHTQHQVVTTYSDAHDAIVAHNTFNPTFAGMRAFAALSEPLSSFTADRREFVGRNGSLLDPAALRDTAPLSRATRAGIDPCAALQCTLTLAAGETREVAALLGAAQSDEEANALLTTYRDAGRAARAVDASATAWTDRLSTITVRTPEPSFDAMLNRWSLYQTLSCRMWGRAAVYQSSGAFGFRDQLQDAMALVYAEPQIARNHIIRAAGRQFVEGDVQHWWHPPDGRGVRTRFSDDLAWLPFVVEHYVRVTGDVSVLDESAGFITMHLLRTDEQELYDLPQPLDRHASVYAHCMLALHKACTVGDHGLPLMGIGDWNDGMNRVGVGGKGESVWLAWFLAKTLRAFAPLAEQHGDADAARDFRAKADAYAAAVEKNGWDGAWYRRAYFDDGSPLGSAKNHECRIDSIAQSWSVLSGAGDPRRQRQAMQSFNEQLVREDARLIMLLTPPFDETERDPGYIKGYLPGVRENGAQYTHAALWAVQATAMLGDGDRAFELYQMINPLTHARTAQEVATYKVEPYVLAADVYTADGQLGRGGWTWYTGSASWMYRVGLESILGFTKSGNTLRIEPRVPKAWTEFSIEYRFGASVYAITVRRGEQTMPSVEIDLVDDGQRHEVHVVLPNNAADLLTR